MLDPSIAADLIPGRNLVAYHEVVRVGAYLYGRDRSAEGCWELDEVLYRFEGPGDEFPEAFDPQTEEETEMLRRLPLEMRDWKEKRGDEVMEWNG
jgi:hypothetical protein